MTKMRLVAVMTALVIAPFCQLTAQQQPSPLAAAYPTKVGDMAAQTLSELLKIRTDFKDAAVVTYEPTTQTIDVEVFATPQYGSKTDQARALLGKYWDFIKAGHIPYVERPVWREVGRAELSSDVLRPQCRRWREVGTSIRERTVHNSVVEARWTRRKF